VKYVIKRDEVLVGFREKASPFVADMSDCSVLDQRLAALIVPLKLMISSLTVKASIPQIEVAASEDMIVVVVRHLEALAPEDVNILGQFSSKHGIRIMTQAAGPDSVIPLPGEAPAVLSYSIRGEGLVFEFEPLDFTQVNFSMNEQMTNQALDLLNLQADDQVIDAFCGIGNFTLPIAKRVTSVLGLESAEASVQRAQKNAKKNAVSNALFEVQDLYAKEGVPDLLGYNKMLIDPPRSGAEQLVQSPLIDRLERIVYVSCYPETLARDAEYLVKRGFRVDAVGLIDMFPHTAHLESMALFVREASYG
jgi:23S rRNA (uracil1939-C5)-methyltransferase